MLPARLAALPPLQLQPPLTHLHGRRAHTPLARLRGLAGLGAPHGVALLLPRTRSVHTFGMRFALDLVWLDRDGRVLRVDRAVPPRRLRACRRARAVLETAPGGADGLRPGSPVLSPPTRRPQAPPPRSPRSAPPAAPVCRDGSPGRR
ncbi:MAG TPA: DUF192 domain-containing protein [Conexibacter sp.]|nr:DUF192 domain-containing protein [Conexibacter sp.]